MPDEKRKDDGKPARVNRMARFAETMIAQIPEIENYAYVFGLLQRIGMYSSGMNGPVPIEWGQIESWSNLMGVQLTPGECEAIKGLSAEYCGQYGKSSDLDEFPPAAITEDGKDYDREYMAQLTMISRGRKPG